MSEHTKYSLYVHCVELCHKLLLQYLTLFVCQPQETLHSHRVEKERILSEQEKQGQPRHVAQIRRARTSLPTNDQDATSHSAPNSNSAAAAHPTSISSLCPRDDTSNINIICCWSALVGNGEDKKVYGQHHLRNLMVRPQKTSKGCPLALTANHPSKVSHNFNLSPLVSNMIRF